MAREFLRYQLSCPNNKIPEPTLNIGDGLAITRQRPANEVEPTRVGNLPCLGYPCLMELGRLAGVDAEIEKKRPGCRRQGV